MKQNNILLVLSIVILSACQNASFLTKKYDVRGHRNFKCTDYNLAQLTATTHYNDVVQIAPKEEVSIRPEIFIAALDTEKVDSMEVIQEEYVPMPDDYPYDNDNVVPPVEDEGDYALPYDEPQYRKKGKTGLLKATSFILEAGIALLCVLGIIALIAAIGAGSLTGVMLVLAILGIIALFAIGLLAALMIIFTVAMLLFLIVMKLGGPGKIGG